jgi:hypothetical protein
VPPAGAKLDAFGLSFIVRDADERRIAKVEIMRLATSEVPPSSDGAPPTESPPSSRPSKPIPFPT